MESSHPETLQLLLKDDTIRSARIVVTSGFPETSVKTFGMGSSRMTTTEPSSQSKDVKANSVPGQQTDVDLFTSVVGVEGGKYFPS
jgi:DNA excision repair protein ERCC-3